MTARVLALVVLLAASLQAQVTFDRLLHPEKEPQNWLTYSGSLFNQRFSPLTQITTANVKNLELQWIWQAKSLEKYEATSIVVDGILYTVQAPNDVVALDAVTGRPYWTFGLEAFGEREQVDVQLLGSGRWFFLDNPPERPTLVVDASLPYPAWIASLP